MAYKFKKISMNQLFKSALIVAVSLGASTSFAECNTDTELKLIKFLPSSLSAYVPKNTVINETVYDGPEDYDIHYNIQYKQQQIRVSLAAADFPNYDDSPYNVSTHKQTTQLTNVSPESKLIKLPCDDKICSSAYFGSNNSFNKGFTSIIRYSQSAKEQSIGDEFVKSLFVDTSDCVAAEPDSLTYNGPFQIYLLFKANSATLSDMSVHNPKMMGYFSQFVNRNNIKIHIEGHTDKTENIKDKMSVDNDINQEYHQTLSEQRAQAAKAVLVTQYGINPDNIKQIKSYGSSQPVAFSDTEENRQHNRRVKVYIPW